MAVSSRERTMTGGSTGSFASYYIPHDDYDCGSDDSDDYNVSTREPPHHAVAAVTPEKKEESHSATLQQELQRAQRQAREAMEAYEKLSAGVRIIVRQMKQHSSNDNNNNHNTTNHHHSNRDGDSSSCCSSTVVTMSSPELEDLAQHAWVGADLLRLSDAAQMVREHATMASQEASELVRDAQEAQEDRRRALARAAAAESRVASLEAQQQQLSRQVHKSQRERKVLIRKVKALMAENAALQQEQQQQKQEGMMRAVELHVAGALQMHERQLLLSQRDRKSVEKSEETTASNASVHRESEVLSSEASSTPPLKEAASEDTQENSAAPIEPDKEPQDYVSSKEKTSYSLGFGGAGALGFALKSPGWMGRRAASTPTAAKPKEEEVAKPEKDESIKTEKENCANDSASVSTPYVPLKFTSSRSSSPLTPIQRNPQSTVSQELSPEASSLSSLYLRRPVPVKKSLLELDEESVGADGSTKRDAAKEESRSESNSQLKRSLSSERSVPSAPDIYRHFNTAFFALPRNVTCQAAELSPLNATDDSPTQNARLLDDKVFRSLSIPRMSIPEDNIKEESNNITVGALSSKEPCLGPRPTSCPPEISRIFEEINHLYEC